MKFYRLLVSITFISFSSFLFANDIKIDLSKMPELESLKPNSKNILFKEFNSIVESNYKKLSSGDEPEYIFFKYKNTENFNLISLSSRCCINYDTIATLNQIESADTDIRGKTLILPTMQGLYIPVEKAGNSIEVLLQEHYSIENSQSKNQQNNCSINGHLYAFFPGKRFSSTERLFFLDSGCQLPLDQDSFWISSEFGKRKNPFSGEIKNHNGIDLAAEEGTPVYAIKDGAVAYTIENDPEFGNYIILSHDLGKSTSVYAHLSKIAVEQYKSIKKGAIIGYVGRTGKATGPHLHFEIRQGGKPEDPRQKLNLGN